MTIINIDPKKVNEAGNTILNNAKTMKTSLDNIKTIVNGTKKCFESDAGETARKNFNKSSEKFLSFKREIDSYGLFLQSYSGAHVELDKKLDKLGKEIPPL